MDGNRDWPVGASYIGLWLLNPFTINVLLPTDDIDGWLNRIAWTERMMLWLPVPALFTAVLLVIVTIRQRRSYALLDARARSSR